MYALLYRTRSIHGPCANISTGSRTVLGMVPGIVPMHVSEVKFSAVSFIYNNYNNPPQMSQKRSTRKCPKKEAPAPPRSPQSRLHVLNSCK